MTEAVTELKQRPGKNIVSLRRRPNGPGSPDQPDRREYQLVVPPVALGDGEPLFSNCRYRLKLRLVEVRELKAGALFLRYHPAAAE